MKEETKVDKLKQKIYLLKSQNDLYEKRFQLILDILEGRTTKNKMEINKLKCYRGCKKKAFAIIDHKTNIGIAKVPLCVNCYAQYVRWITKVSGGNKDKLTNK